ncbi:MAG: SWF/SNF helicase family protein [Myxococcales bacterium]|nr:SWF/SNF helicase family protein [Myxococcales bacterium]
MARRHREAPDAKLAALLAWIRAHQCPAAGLPQAGKKAPLQWTDRRVLVFTEYGDTKNYLVEQLTRAVGHTEDGDARILVFHGGMSEPQREAVQRAFNGDPAEHPVRILIATDAAREGLNLQARCADLFHYDIPWNPARMEQRNGRIDRALQPAPTVRCHYFVYEHRPEDRVLAALVAKVATIGRELGSLATVVFDELEHPGARPG